MAEPFVGEIKLFPFNYVPQGWAQCNGQILSIQQNQALYSIIGIKYGGDGRTTFALPDLRGRVPISSPTEVGLSGGEATHTLTIDEIPQHTHMVKASSNPATSTTPARNVWAEKPNRYHSATNLVAMNGEALSIVGSSQGHNNMQPYLTINFCIAIVGIYPSRS